MPVISFLFWFSAVLLLYSYIGYGLLVWVWKGKKEKKTDAEERNWPEVTVVIPAFNEAAILQQKLNNTLALNYPKDKLKIVVVADGSTDDSLQLLQGYPMVHTLYQPLRQGKTAALNRAMQQVQSPITVFTDADTLLQEQSIRKIITHFTDEKTGGVAGEKKIRTTTSGVGHAEGWYWRYESLMKRLDARFYTVIGAAGELFAIRTALYQPLNEKIILDDFMLSLQICLKGYCIAYEPEAFAIEMPTTSLTEEEKRKVRIAAGAFQVLELLSFNRLRQQPVLLFQFLSRRWLRWVLCPFLIIILLLCNVLLAWTITGIPYQLFLAAQLLFYAAAAMGGYLMKKNKSNTWITLPFYFLFMNYCLLKGLMQYRTGRYSVLWPKPQRPYPGNGFIP